MPSKELPLHSTWSSEEAYVDSLLSFASSSTVFRNLCGGIHILDFLTREPDLYSTVLPVEWRSWFDAVDIHDLLDLLFREDLKLIGGSNSWRHYVRPPSSLLNYISMVQKHCLQRDFIPLSDGTETMPRHIAVGMKPKKVHEVSNFAAYVDKLSSRVSNTTGRPVSGIVDFGSGQNYLGRTLASPPYCQDVVAIERRHHNVTGARGMDVYAKLAKKQRIVRNKKEYREQLRQEHDRASLAARGLGRRMELGSNEASARPIELVEADVQDGRGSVTYIEHDIKDGYLEDVLGLSQQQPDTKNTTADPSSGSDTPSTDPTSADPTESAVGSLATSTSSLSLERSAAIPVPSPNLLVVSLHSCGNLLHHGIRSLTLNHSVSAVAMIGCCYNLMTERLGVSTYKLPTLRSLHPRLESTSSSQDPHGFPMSGRLCKYASNTGETGIRLNITARMMAVQAPDNWGREDSEAFFTRHFYRALLQRILLDRGVVKQSSEPDSLVGGTISGNSRSAKDVQGSPLIIGSLPKTAFTSFNAYIKSALAKLTAEKVEDAPVIHQRTKDLTEEVIRQYEEDWMYARKNLAIIWSLMAFSAGVVESVIAVDRWLFLKEQECVERAWIEPVFDYKQSPRNLCVVGIKKRSGDYA